MINCKKNAIKGKLKMKAYEKLSEFYRNIWGKDSARYAELVINVINSIDLKVSSILDIGCGTGILVNQLKNLDFKLAELIFQKI